MPAARKTIAAVWPMRGWRRFLLIVVCIFLWLLGAARFFSDLEPNSSTLVVYDAGKRVWDDKNLREFCLFGLDKL